MYITQGHDQAKVYFSYLKITQGSFETSWNSTHPALGMIFCWFTTPKSGINYLKKDLKKSVLMWIGGVHQILSGEIQQLIFMKALSHSWFVKIIIKG